MVFSDLNQQLAVVKEKQRKKKKWEKALQHKQTYYQQEKSKAEQLFAQLRKEEEDVQKLEGLSITNLFFTFLGHKLEKLDQEKQEALAAKLKYDEAQETIEDVSKEIKEIEDKLVHIGNVDTEYKQILSEKERLIHDHRSVWSEELYQLAEQEADLTTQCNEFEEAISAGKTALGSLERAIRSLDKAKGWATWDMFGGGMISTAVKHSHLDDAQQLIHQAQNHLRNFQEELGDIEQHFSITSNMGNLLTFADYFFDGFIVDWVVRGRITDSLQQTINTRDEIGQLVQQLVQGKESLQSKLQLARQQRLSLLESSQ